MPDLPKVEQEFSADVTAYVSNLQAAIAKTKTFASAVGDAITKVNELNAALKALPDMKTITIVMTGMDEALAKTATLKNSINDLPTTKTIFINEVVNQVQGTEVSGIKAATEVVNETLGTEAGGVSAATQVVNQARGSEAGNAISTGTEIVNEVPGVTLGGDTEATLTAMGLGLGGGEPSSSAAAAWDAVANAENSAAAASNNMNTAARSAAGSIDDENVELSALARSLLNAINEGGEWRAQNESAVDAAVTWANAQHSVTDAINASNIEAGSMTAQWDQLTEAQKNAAISIDDQDTSLRAFSGAINNNRAALGGLNIQQKQTNDGIAAGAAILGAAYGFWMRWGTAVHWVLAGSMEFLAVAVPAFIALGSAAFVALQGVQNAYERIGDIYTVMEALGPTLNKTAGDLLGLGHAGQAAQDAMQPQVYEALGGVIAALQTHLGNLATVGSEVITLFDTWLAKFDIELRGAFGDQLNGLISKGVTDLTEFGQVFANLGRTILNLAADMPGLAEVLLKVLDAFTDLLKIISEIPAPIITTIMAIEEFFRWGALLVSLFSKLVIGAGALVGVFSDDLGNAIKGLGVTVGDAGGHFSSLIKLMVGLGDAEAMGISAVSAMAIAWGVVAVAALIGFGIYIDKAKSGVDEWIASTDKVIDTAPDYAQINDTIKALGQNTVMTAQAQDVLNTKTSAWSALASGAQENVTALSNQHKQLTQDLLTETGDIAYISKTYGVSYTDAIAYATAAGVKLTTSMQGNSEAAQVARQMIQNMITGYEAMGQQGTQVTADINAVTIANSGQLSSVQKLNSAWSTVIGLGEGVQTSFISFAQGLNTIKTDAAAAGASFNGLNAASLTLRSDFESNIGNMSTSLQSLNTALSFGGVSWNQYREAVASEVKEMLDMGNLSAAQVSQLGLIANAAGYTGNSYSSLSKWANSYGGSQTQLNNIMGQATAALSKENTLAGELQGTLQTDVVQATANATLAQSGFQGALIKTQAAFESSGAGSATFQKDLLQLDESMRQAGVSQQAIVQENNILDGSNQNLSNSVANTAEKVKNLSSSYTAASVAGNSWQDDIKNVFTAIMHYAEDYTDATREAIVSGWNLIASTVKSNWDNMVSVANVVIGALKTAWDTAENDAKTIWNDIKNDMLQPMESGIDSLKAFISSSFDTWWKSHGQEVEEIWAAVWDTIRTDTTSAADTIEKITETMWNTLVSVGRTIGNVMLGDIKVLWDGVESDTRDAWDAIEPIVQLGWSLVKSFFDIAIGDIKAAWQVFWGSLEMSAKDSFDAIAAVIKVIWDTIVGIFDVAIDLLTGHWSQAWDDLLNTGKQDWNAISAFFKQAWNSFAGYASTTFHDIGSDIVGGLKNGILSAASAIGSFIKNNLVNPIINAVKSFFGISSPSTVMAGLGGNLVSGLLQGLEHSPDKLISDVFGGWPNALAKILGKGLISIADLPAKLISNLMKTAGSIFDDIFGGGGGTSGTSTPTGANAGIVISAIDQAIKDTGVPQAWFNDLATIASYESGDNPNAINLTDSNAAAGDPSRGLMQTIMTTFDAYHQAGTSSNIYDPVANVAAAINYIKAVYGSVYNVPGIVSLSHGGGYVGYDSGGLLMPGYTMAANLTGRPERIVPADQGIPGGDLHVHMQVGGQEIARAIFRDFQKEVLQYNVRNSGGGNISGALRPRNGLLGS